MGFFAATGTRGFYGPFRVRQGCRVGDLAEVRTCPGLHNSAVAIGVGIVAIGEYESVDLPSDVREDIADGLVKYSAISDSRQVGVAA